MSVPPPFGPAFESFVPPIAVIKEFRRSSLTAVSLANSITVLGSSGVAKEAGTGIAKTEDITGCNSIQTVQNRDVRKFSLDIFGGGGLSQNGHRRYKGGNREREWLIYANPTLHPNNQKQKC